MTEDPELAGVYQQGGAKSVHVVERARKARRRTVDVRGTVSPREAVVAAVGAATEQGKFPRVAIGTVKRAIAEFTGQPGVKPAGPVRSGRLKFGMG